MYSIFLNDLSNPQKSFLEASLVLSFGCSKTFVLVFGVTHRQRISEFPIRASYTTIQSFVLMEENNNIQRFVLDVEAFKILTNCLEK
ncbi:hypothetical protein RI543_004587 [Arxiozyma heterogenica]|uniref:Uncharacterized protein n=1 Tax=Arxiozyma heterogenica TaxID=278026 RepID=A0AAN7WEL9_9SACH|nr:hypothetical protein RI543_004587 [Kazachstania heterogenica]